MVQSSELFPKSMPVSKTILLIDDDHDILDIYCLALEKAGFRVVTEDNGLHGLMKAVAVQPDIILLDIMMPGMDGFKTLDAFCNCTDIRSKILIFSNFGAGYQDVDTLIRIGALDCLVKSDYPPSALVAKMSTL